MGERAASPERPSPPDDELVRRAVGAAWRAIWPEETPSPTPNEDFAPTLWRQVRAVVAEVRAGEARPGAADPAFQESAHALAMLALQSDRYQKDPDYRDAVDSVLSFTASRSVRSLRAALSGGAAEPRDASEA